MKLLNIMGNSFGCSASGERLVTAARDGDLQEATALLEYNPRLARYSTFGVRNSPLHYSAAQGHHEIVSLLLVSGVDINLRNYRGQTALMQACQHGHWEVVLTLILFKANIHRADYLNGGTALHLAALNGHTRCIRLVLADYVPSIADCWTMLRNRGVGDESIPEFDISALHEIIDMPADGGITALHMAALNGHVESVQLLLDLGASISKVTVEDGSTIDLIGAGSTPLHYAACGGNAQCCQILIARGASLIAENANGWTPLMVARSWHRTELEEILCMQPEHHLPLCPSSYLSVPLMSIVKISRIFKYGITSGHGSSSGLVAKTLSVLSEPVNFKHASELLTMGKPRVHSSRDLICHSYLEYTGVCRECGWRNGDHLPTCLEPCVVCLERKCTVAAEGCAHEFCTPCALYLCCTISTVAQRAPGSVACPLCRHGIFSFVKLPETRVATKAIARTCMSLSLCSCSCEEPEPASITTPLCKPEINCTNISPLSSSFRSLSCQKFPSFKLNASRCIGAGDTSPSLVRSSLDPNIRERLVRYSKPRLRRSASNSDQRRSWLSAINDYVTIGSGC